MTDRDYPHLQIRREEPVTTRKSPKGFRPKLKPDDPQAHGRLLKQRVEVLQRAEPDLGGFDDRRLIKLHLSTTVPPEDIVKVARGITVVSQEDAKLVLAFATEAQLVDFQQKLGRLAAGSHVTYKEFMYAIRDLDKLTPDDRKGWSLRQEGLPQKKIVVVDVELWPLAVDGEMTSLRTAFEEWLKYNGGKAIDSVRQPYLSLYRVEGSRNLIDKLLRHRDVRLVDLPPRVALDRSLRFRDVQELDEIRPPPADAPGVVVLDSGVASGHPVLAPAIGDSQSFLPGKPAVDDDGHGTLVAGIALYGDVAECLKEGHFVPELRLYSGRILGENSEGDRRLVENQVDEAVRYFVDNYKCKIFNLSYGDLRKPYRGRHVRGLAVTLDSLSRELDVLFVIPTGNLDVDGSPANRYPEYLLDEVATLIDPAPALNALTVGSLARYDRSTRWPDDPAYEPVARTDQPSPFTRRGPSVNEAIKPDLVDYGGNQMVNRRTGLMDDGTGDVGELSTWHKFTGGRPFMTCHGTSYAVPRVTNLAAKVLVHNPHASPDLCRALLVAHARIPSACTDLLSESDTDVRHVAGYGMVDRSALFRSLDDRVTLWAMDSIANKRHHFFDIPIPEEYWSRGRRSREMTVALAYRPPMRTTRADYRAVRINFVLVQSDSVEQVARSFDAAIDLGEVQRMSERNQGRNTTAQMRSRGTVQASTWQFKQPSPKARRSRWVVVVTRNDPAWGEGLASEREEYALAVVLADRQADQARLYDQIMAELRTPLRARAARPA